jgi:ribokinase
MKVLNIGSLNLDHVYNVDHIVQPGETEATYELNIHLGGKGMNQSVALAKAGVTVYHGGMIGDDGQPFLDACKEFGVQADYIRQIDTKSGHAIIQIDKKAQNSILLYPGANCMISENEIVAVLEKQSPGTWLLLQNEINSIPFLIREAKKRGMKIAINPAPCTDAVKDYPLELVDLLFVNEIEASQLSGCQGSFEAIADALAKQYPQAQIVMTLGSAGAIYRCGAYSYFEPACPVKVVDTTSAGDTFCGYFLSSLLKGMTPEKAMFYAAKASSVTVSRAGAAQSIPSAEEIFS